MECKFTVQPVGVYQDVDHPDLTASKSSPVPNSNKTHVVTGDLLAGGAAVKWDVSRQLRIKVINPYLYPVSNLIPVPGYLWEGQPALETVPEDYPSDQVEGNDDTHTGDENNFPLLANGRLTSEDHPKASMLNTTGNNGEAFSRAFLI